MSRTRTGQIRIIGYAVVLLAGAAATGLTAWLVVDALRTQSKVSWMLGRASGLTSYLLLAGLVTTGLLLSHPWSRRMRYPSVHARILIHVTLALFTLAFTVLHVVVLATDPWAKVGWQGALLPMASTYRPVAVTLGVIALWAGLITGVTARLAGRFAVRIWWPIHKVSAGILVLVWAHSMLAGTDAPILRWWYLATGAAIVGLAVTRYSARTPADKVAELDRSMRPGRFTAEPEDADSLLQELLR